MSIHLDEIHNANNKEETLQEYVIFQLTFIVTLPLVTFLILNPTVGIMSSLNWPDCIAKRYCSEYTKQEKWKILNLNKEVTVFE